MGEIKSITGKVDKNTLIELSQDPELSGYAIICFWKDRKVTAGWSYGLNHTELAYGLKLLDHEITNKLFLTDHPDPCEDH